ncbi:MAG: GNAT family N-acetyltransferase [Candidatus Latescibacteria bacterium]|nr:GNAT family N-acetyltransferase [Candidatus Latescibacterota bacterium]
MADTAALATLTHRRYDPEQDFPRLVEYHRSAWALTGLTGNWHVGDLNYIVWENWTFASRETQPFYIWADGTGAIQAFALINHHWGAYQLRCHPSIRGSRLLEGLVQWCEEHLCENAINKERIGAMGVDAADQAFAACLQARGYSREGEGNADIVLAHGLDELAVPQVPNGYAIKAIGLDDVEGRAGLARAIWDDWGMWGDAKVTGAQYGDYIQTAFYASGLDWVAVTPEGQFVAAITCGIDPEGRVGTVMDMGTLPDHRRKGLARALMLTALQGLKEAGMKRVLLSTGFDDARQFYQSVGFTLARQAHAYELKTS